MPLEVVEPIFAEWLKVFQHHEVGTVFFLPHCDVLFRVKQFVNWLKTKHNLIPCVVDLEFDLLSDPKQLSDFLLQNKTKPILLLAKRGFVNPSSAQWQTAIDVFRLEQTKGVLVIHEAAPCELKALNTHTSFTQNQTLYPLYTPEQAFLFCSTLAKDWNIKLSTQDLVSLTQYCGGPLWFIKEALRQLRDGKNQTIAACQKSEDFLWKTNQFWNDLPQEYRAALLNLKLASRATIAELIRFNLIQNQPHLDGYSTWPFLEPKITQSRQDSFVCLPTKVTYFENDFTQQFSKAERRVLAELWSKRNDVVSREALASQFWGENADEKYSDWALDQVIRRLRSKILAAKLPITVTTKRGLGYVAAV